MHQRVKDFQLTSFLSFSSPIFFSRWDFMFGTFILSILSLSRSLALLVTCSFYSLSIWVFVTWMIIHDDGM